MFKNGFTLAEVLITLGVIGVIAVLTLPSVITNYQNKVLMTQLQRSLNIVKDAARNAMADEAAGNFLELVKGPKDREKFLKEYFDVVNYCDSTSGYNGCLAARYTNFDKTQSETPDSINVGAPIQCVAIPSGASICMGGKSHQIDGRHTVRIFLIDINGIKEPNITGKDFFYVGVSELGKLVYNANPDKSDAASFDNAIQREANGELCTTNGRAHPIAVNCLPYIISHGWQYKF